MAIISLRSGELPKIREVNPLMASYNVEMTEVTGGTFWKRYTPEQIAGTEGFELSDLSQFATIMEVYPPKDLSDPRLRMLAGALGPAWVRVSGSWASNTYYDFDGTTGGKAPEGFASVLTREQWTGVLDFVKAIGGHLMVSVANSAGAHNADGTWNPEQAKLLFDFSRDYGVPIEAAEFMNEPNALANGQYSPADYDMADYARDQDAFFRFLRENYPGTLCVGPSASDGSDPSVPTSEVNTYRSPILDKIIAFRTSELMPVLTEPADVFSYHWYNGISERGAKLIGNHWDASEAMGERYLDVTRAACEVYVPLRDRYTPGAPMWVTETGDAGMGGDTWASTYLEVFRTANELGTFGELTDGVLFHNTLASSDYGWLDHGDYTPRPNYWFVLLWNRLMGTTVYHAGEPTREGVHLFARSRKDGHDGVVYLLINNSATEPTVVRGADGGSLYLLDAEGTHAANMRLNGRTLALETDGTLPALEAVPITGELTVPPASIAFIVL